MLTSVWLTPITVTSMLSVTIPRGLIIVPVSLDTLEMEFPVAQVTTCFCSLLFTYMIEVFPRIDFVIDYTIFHWTKKWICTNLLLANISQICKNWGVNLGQRWWMPHLSSYLHPCFLVSKCGFYHIYSSVFTNLQHIGGSKFSNPFFRPVFENKAIFLYILRYLCQPCGGPCALVL